MKEEKKMEKVKEERVTYSLPIGPQHPMYVEAENLNVYLDGETIVDVDINVGYLHRGIEELMQRRNYLQNIYLSERICGICSGIHSMTYCQCIENLLDVNIPERAKYIRTMVLELERLHSHFLFLGVVGYEIGMDTAFMYAWKDREFSMDMLEQVSGNRVNYAMPTVGGVRRDVPNHIIPSMLKKLNHLEKRTEYYRKVFLRDRTIIARTRGLGILPKKDVERFSIVGPVARASGLKIDVRRDTPYLKYDDLDWKVIVEKAEDSQSRVMVKVLEIFQSIKILRQCLKKLPSLDREIKTKVPLVIPKAEAIAITEAPRGELVYYAMSNGTDRPERMRIRTPSFVNIIYSLPIILKEQQLADLPAIVASIDPCFSCTDRMTLIDTKSGEKKTVDETYLKKLGERRLK
ncbi:MAG: nickel-dependent hydrogenase large subunit [Candidatus Aenigmatarchaeota archaeon]|nr:MAG: nickel-dependent hydrogenase large subunit [Candidatus Aenigmarchaeota archaeon]